jgi:hypothetical protein
MVATVELGAESVVKGRWDAGVNLPADDVLVKRETGIPEHAHEIVARHHARVDLAHICRLETVTLEPERRQEDSRLGPDGAIIDMAGIGDMNPERALATGSRPKGHFR